MAFIQVYTSNVMTASSLFVRDFPEAPLGPRQTGTAGHPKVKADGKETYITTG